MHLSEIFGRTLKVNFSKPPSSINSSTRAVWESDEFQKRFVLDEEEK
jgi:hypothetical protein